MTLVNTFGEPIDPYYEPFIADVYRAAGWSTDPLKGTGFNGGDEFDEVVFALNWAADNGYRVPEDVLAPIDEQIEDWLANPFGAPNEDAFTELAKEYVDRIRALDDAA